MAAAMLSQNVANRTSRATWVARSPAPAQQSLPLGRRNAQSLSSSFKGLSLANASLSSARVAPLSSVRKHCLSTPTMAMEAGIGVLGNKVGMLTWFTEDGQAVPCTVIGFHEGNIVTQVKREETDGYSAVQVGYKRVRSGGLSKPEEGHLQKIGAPPMRHLQEWRLASDVTQSFTVGQKLQIEELFKEGDLVDISGTSIGKGFAGGIKRHNFARGNKTHGSKSYRQLGSIGAGTTPGRVYPGKKMPGQLGNATTKIRKLTVMKVDPELHAVLIKGCVPGKVGNLLRISPAKIVGKNIPMH